MQKTHIFNEIQLEHDLEDKIIKEAKQKAKVYYKKGLSDLQKLLCLADVIPYKIFVEITNEIFSGKLKLLKYEHCKELTFISETQNIRFRFLEEENNLILLFAKYSNNNVEYYKDGSPQEIELYKFTSTPSESDFVFFYSLKFKQNGDVDKIFFGKAKNKFKDSYIKRILKRTSTKLDMVRSQTKQIPFQINKLGRNLKERFFPSEKNRHL